MKFAMRRRYTGETRRTTEMIRNTQLPDERMQGARDYLARDQLRQDMEAGRQARRTEEATGPENVAQERFYTGAQGRTLGAAPLIQGAINIPISAMMYPFLTQEQKAGRSFDEFVSDMSSVGYDQARGSIDRAREKRPLESLGLEIAGGFIAGKTAYDDLGNRFLASQPGARGALVGAGSGAQYEFLESEGDPLAAGRGALIGAPVGAGVSKAMEAAAEPLGRLFRGEVPMPKLGPEATNAAYGAGLGGIAPADSAEERAQNMVVGAGIGLAPGVINRVRGAGTVGAPKINPETIRSAKSEGYDTSRVLYRGMREPLSSDGLYATTTPGYETQGLGVSLSTSAKAAAEYGENVYPVVVRGKFFSEKEYVNRINKLYETQGMGPRDAAVRVRAQLAAEGYAGLKADGGKLLDKGELRVWGDDSGLVPNVKVLDAIAGNASETALAGPGGYFGRQSMRPPGSGPSPREIETRQQWATATPIVTQARTTAQSAQQAADAALQSKAPADIARAKDAKNALVGQIKEAQASRAGMDTPEDARLAETLASLTENTSDPVLLSTQISAAKTSLDRLLTDIGSPVEGNLIPVRTNILTRTQAPRSAAEGPQDRASVTRYAEGEAPPVKGMGFGAGTPKTPQQAVRFETPGSPEYEAAVAKGLDMSQAGRMGRRKSWQEAAGTDPEIAEMVLYHGTTEDVKAFDPAMFGKNTGDKDAKLGVWLSPRASDTNYYAGYDPGGSVLPRQAYDQESQQLFNTLTREAGLAQKLDAVASYKQQLNKARLDGYTDEQLAGAEKTVAKLQQEIDGVYKQINKTIADQLGPVPPTKTPKSYEDGANIMPVYVRGNIFVADINGPYDPNQFYKIAQEAKANGYSGVKFSNVDDLGESAAGLHDQFVIFDPSNIRSVNAAFDPEKSGSSTLLAAAPFAAVSGVGAGTAMGEDD
jgi:hypothetical protein